MSTGGLQSFLMSKLYRIGYSVDMKKILRPVMNRNDPELEVQVGVHTILDLLPHENLIEESVVSHIKLKKL